MLSFIWLCFVLIQHFFVDFLFMPFDRRKRTLSFVIINNSHFFSSLFYIFVVFSLKSLRIRSWELEEFFINYFMMCVCFYLLSVKHFNIWLCTLTKNWSKCFCVCVLHIFAFHLKNVCKFLQFYCLTDLSSDSRDMNLYWNKTHQHSTWISQRTWKLLIWMIQFVCAICWLIYLWSGTFYV